MWGQKWTNKEIFKNFARRKYTEGYRNTEIWAKVWSWKRRKSCNRERSWWERSCPTEAKVSKSSSVLNSK